MARGSDSIGRGLVDVLKAGIKAVKAKSTKPGAAATPKPEAKGRVTVKGRKKSTTEVGKCGEKLARQDMEADGFEVVEVQNKSGHGIDLIGRDKDGNVKVWEVKTTEGTKAPELKGDQRLGGEKFTKDRLERATEGKGNYDKVPKAKKNAEKVNDWIDKAKRRKKKVAYEKREVFIDDTIEGCAKHPGRDSKSKPWEAVKPRKPKK